MKLLKSFLFVFSFITSLNSYCQIDGSVDDLENSLSAIIGYNFLGKENSSLSNLTPEVFYGISKKHELFKISNLNYYYKIGPYVSSQISINDSSAYLPSLMMQGNGGIIFNNYITYGENNKIIFSPISLGMKLLSGYTDNDLTIIQHNYRTSLGIQIEDLFVLTFQYTIGAHGMTSNSEENFKEIFETQDPKNAQYLNITLQSKIAKQEDDPDNAWYIFASWRSFLNSSDFNNLPNTKILSIGLRKSLDFTAGSPAK